MWQNKDVIPNTTTLIIPNPAPSGSRELVRNLGFYYQKKGVDSPFTPKSFKGHYSPTTGQQTGLP